MHLLLAGWHAAGLPAACLLLVCWPAASSCCCRYNHIVNTENSLGTTVSPSFALAGGRSHRRERERNQERRGRNKESATAEKQHVCTHAGWNETTHDTFQMKCWADRMTNFLRAVHDLDAHRANHRLGCGKQEAPTYTYITTLPIGFATTNRPFLLQEIWGRSSRVPIWQRETWHQYIPKGFAAENFLYNIHLHSSKSSLCAMFLPLLDTFGYMMLYVSLYHHRCNRLCHGGCPSLMSLSTTWCWTLCHRDVVTCPRLMWLQYCLSRSDFTVLLSYLVGKLLGGRSDCGCTYGICYETWMVLRFK